MVVQLLQDLKDVQLVNQQLDQMYVPQGAPGELRVSDCCVKVDRTNRLPWANSALCTDPGIVVLLVCVIKSA